MHITCCACAYQLLCKRTTVVVRPKILTFSTTYTMFFNNISVMFQQKEGESLTYDTPSLYCCFYMMRYYAFFSFSKSRISMRSFSSLLGSGALGVSAGFSSSFLAVTLLTTLMSMKIQKATIRKSKVVCRKLP